MASGDQYGQALVEAAPNAEATPNAISATQIWVPYTEFGLLPDRVTDDRTDEMRGTAEPITPDVTGWNQTTGAANGRLYPNAIGLFFTTLLGYVAPTAGDGIITDPDSVVIPVGATRHVWDSSTLNPALIRTAQFRRNYGNNTSLFLIDRGVTTTQLDLEIGDQNAPSTFSASVAGLYQAKIADPSLTPSYDATTIKPFYRGQFSIQTWLANTAAPIGCSLSFTNPVEPDPVLSASLFPTSWSRPNEAGAVPRLTGTIDAKTVDPDDYDAFTAGTAFTYKMKWVSNQNIGASGYPYKLFIEGAASYDNYEAEAIQHKLRHGAQIPFSAGKSGGTQAFKVTLVCGVTSYSSVS